MHSHCLALSNPVSRILITYTYYRPTPSGGEGMYLLLCDKLQQLIMCSCKALAIITYSYLQTNKKFNIFVIKNTKLKNVDFDVKFECDECFVTSKDNILPYIKHTYDFLLFKADHS